MEFLELGTPADAGGALDVKSRGKTIEFGDGYKQTVYVGRKRLVESLAYDRTADITDAHTIYAGLLSILEQDQSFYYSFTPRMPKRLYKIEKDSLKITHIGGHTYKVSATFEEWSGMGKENYVSNV